MTQSDRLLPRLVMRPNGATGLAPAAGIVALLGLAATLGWLMQPAPVPQPALRIVVPETPPAHDHAGGVFMEATGDRYLLMEVENLHETLAEAEAMGCAVPVPPREIRPGRTVCQIQDPDGNHVELAQATPVSG